ncbi:membrane protein insertase YidC [[Mycoplasma] collis]|uniref:membrane protein insertase YidC n=1 Tax=[Mycoplasma] collis TaxID=2127 RepID=UPI00068F4726|nr:membrane protein insertase YidC [[Mycoplasma] collis]
MKKTKPKKNSYGFFRGNFEENDNKSLLKTIWKAIKIIIYTMIFGISLTGCIQSFVIKSSNQTGSGVEFYSSKTSVSPNVLAFYEENNEIKVRKNNDNYHLDDNTEDKGQIIKKLIAQSGKSFENKEADAYGYWGNKNSLIMWYDFAKKEYKPVSYENKNGDLLFLTSYSTSYEIKEDWKNKEIKILRNIFNIDVPKNEKELSNNNEILEKPETLNFDELFLTLNNPSQENSDSNSKKEEYFSRDVIQFLNNKILSLEKYNDSKYEKALKNVIEKKDKSSIEDRTLVNDYSKNLTKIIKTYTPYTIVNENKILYNYSNPVYPFGSSVEQKAIITWGESWRLGPFYSIFVWPMSRLMIAINNTGSIDVSYGWISIITILIATLITKIISLSFRFRTLFTQNKQQEIQLKKAKIDAKYVKHKGNKQMENKQRQEVAELYKKNNVSPAGPIKQLLVTMPIFLAMWRILQGIPSIKATTWLGINLASTSYQELLYQKEWIYLPILIIVLIVQLVQQILPKLLNRKKNKRMMNQVENATYKKQQKMTYILTVVFIFFGLAFQASVQIYWIFGGIWEIAQILFFHFFQKSKTFKNKFEPWLIRNQKNSMLVIFYKFLKRKIYKPKKAKI